MAKARERDDFEDRYFEQQQKQMDRFEDKLDKNTAISQEALAEVKLTKTRVNHLEVDVEKVHRRLDGMEQIPAKLSDPSELPPWWKDRKIIQIIVYVLAAAILTAIGINVTEVLK